MRTAHSALFLGLCLPFAALAAEPAALDAGAWSTSRGEHSYHRRTMSFRLGGQTYGVSYHCEVGPDGTFLNPGEGPVGMPFPTSENWYHSGFVFLSLNGQMVGASPLSSFEPAESGPRAMADMVWHHPLAEVRYRFLGLPGDDKLLLQIDLEPRQPLTDVKVVLRAYPSYFTGWNHRDGARRVLTPAGVVEEGKSQTLEPGQGWFGVLYDEVFDVDKGQGIGPCAFALLPVGFRKVTVQPAYYPVNLALDCDPAARQFRLAFWEFPKSGNHDVLARFPAAAEQARQVLGETDFAPGIQRQFEYASVRAEMERAKANEAVRKAMGGKLDEAAAWLESCAPLFEGKDAAIAATERFLAGYAKYGGILWDVRLAELLDF
ncbi:MAG: hypothetical protein HYU66_16995 [Armatimonadetes bacterium]|nr:hypothetical protein [Armatimonadota bacterium]